MMNSQALSNGLGAVFRTIDVRHTEDWSTGLTAPRKTMLYGFRYVQRRDMV